MNKKVLFLSPARLGDTLMLTPALALLKSLKPGFVIDILSLTKLGASVYQNNPHCMNIYIHAEIKYIDEFSQRYDLVVAAHRDNKILELIAQLKKPVVLIENADQEQFQAQQALNFIKCMFAEYPLPAQAVSYQLFPSENDRTTATELLNGNRLYIGMHLGCHGINKKDVWLPWYKLDHEKLWPIKQFIELAKTLKLKYPKAQIVLTGGANEQLLAHQFKQQIHDAIDLTGKTSLLELAALVEKLAIYICPDTGTMHVACAMNTPLVTLFGPTNSRRTGPYPSSPYRRVINSKRLLEINQQSVLAAIDDLLNANSNLGSVDTKKLYELEYQTEIID